MYSFLGVFISGGIGSVCRWLTCEKINFHWGTMLVNVLGAFFNRLCLCLLPKTPYRNFTGTKTFYHDRLSGWFHHIFHLPAELFYLNQQQQLP